MRIERGSQMAEADEIREFVRARVAALFTPPRNRPTAAQPNPYWFVVLPGRYLLRHR